MMHDEVQNTVLPLRDPSIPTQGTVLSVIPFDARADATRVQEAIKGWRTDKKKLLNIICHRTNAQRLEIAQAYETMFSKDLLKDLLSKVSGHFETVIIGLMFAPPDFDAFELRDAILGFDDEETLIEILASRTPNEILEIKESFKIIYGKMLEVAIRDDTYLAFKHLMVALITAGRPDTYMVDRLHAVQQAQDLFQAGVSKWGTDDSTFNAILCAENYAQLQMVFTEYFKLAGHDIEDAIDSAIKKEFFGDSKDNLKGLLAVVKCIKNKPAYFAER